MLMYQAYQSHTDLMWPLRTAARLAVPMLQDPTFDMAERSPHREVVAACKVMALTEVTHRRPPWGIDEVQVDGANGFDSTYYPKGQDERHWTERLLVRDAGAAGAQTIASVEAAQRDLARAGVRLGHQAPPRRAPSAQEAGAR